MNQEIRWVRPEEREMLRRNLKTAFPSQFPAAMEQNLGREENSTQGRFLGCFEVDGQPDQGQNPDQGRNPDQGQNPDQDGNPKHRFNARLNARPAAQLLGSILLMDFHINIRSQLHKMGAATYVTTNFLHKKEHIAKNLMHAFHEYYRQQQACIVCLHPFNGAFYEKMGYGYGNENYMYSPRPGDIRSFGNKCGIDYATPQDYEEILALYRSYVAKKHGMTLHIPLASPSPLPSSPLASSLSTSPSAPLSAASKQPIENNEMMFRSLDEERIFGCEQVIVCRSQGQEITGYLTFDFIEVDHYTDKYHDLAVREMVYTDVETLQQFMSFLSSQTDQIERVRIYTPDVAFPLMFTNPDSGENRAYDGPIQEIGRKSMGYMCRILDIPTYFAKQNFCQYAVQKPFTLRLNISDPFEQPHRASYDLFIEKDHLSVTNIIEHSEGRADEHSEEHAEEHTAFPYPAFAGAECRQASAKAKGDDYDVCLNTDIAHLTSLVMGAFSLKQLLHFGRIRLSDPSYADDIQKTIGWDEKPINFNCF